ncbi:MAG: hypothetical protein BWY69_01180 [Planctomycetes bacterium ADurb.Bin401]|nr:MAG: hypothetical protein BWY69_01180 [Planctomycetes bacterium ADurb.Bin401]
MGKRVRCPRCFGKGYLDDRDLKRLRIGRSHAGEKCDFCDGEGKVDRDFDPGDVRPNNTIEDRQKKGGICFITSAYAEYLNKSDDCKELMTLRRYRDTYVLNLDNGGNIIKEYYRIAPLILNSLYESTEKDKIFKQVIIPNLEKCLNLIENNDMEKAFNTYSELVLTLKSLTKIN